MSYVLTHLHCSFTTLHERGHVWSPTTVRCQPRSGCLLHFLEPTHGDHTTYLWKRIDWEVQEGS